MEPQIVMPAKPRVFYSDQLLALKKAEMEFENMPAWKRWLSLMGLARDSGMANFYSSQITNFRASPKTFLKPSELQGRIRVAYFNYTTPAASAPAVAEFVAMTKIPANGRILDLILVWEALTSAGGTAGADWGQATDDQGAGFAADYVAALNMDAAGVKRVDPIIDTLPNVTPYTTERYVCAKVTGEAWAVSKKVQGWAPWVLD